MNRIRALFAHPRLLFPLRLLLGTVFIAAGMAKVRDPHALIDAIQTFRLLPPGGSLVPAIASGLPWLEMLCGALLVGGWRVRAASFALLILNGIFLLAFAQALLRGIDIDCGCFGPDAETGSSRAAWLGLLRDLPLLGMAWVLNRQYRKDGSQDKSCPESRETA